MPPNRDIVEKAKLKRVGEAGDRMHVAVVGAGSLGLLFSGKLSLAGEDVTVITRTAAQAEEIESRGVAVEERGRSMLGRPAAVCGLSGLRRADWIFLMLKQPHIDETLVAQLSEHRSPESNVVCFQNGVGHVERLSRALPKDRIYVAVTTEAARRRSHAEVSHTGRGRIWIGRSDSGAGARLGPLLKMLQNAGFTALASKNMESVIWNKLVANSVINPLTAILRFRNGELLSSSSCRSLMRRLFEEALAVARAAGVGLTEESWANILDVCERTAENQSSMLQDILRGSRSEADWINGSIVRIASDHGIEVPGHTVVYQMIKGLEDGGAQSIISSD